MQDNCVAVHNSRRETVSRQPKCYPNTIYSLLWYWNTKYVHSEVVVETSVQHIYPHVLCIPLYICGWFPTKRSMKCKQSKEINWGDRPSPFSPWFRHKAAGSVLISDLESSPVNKSDNWAGCQTNWIVAVRLRPCAPLKWTGGFDNHMHVLESSYGDYWSRLEQTEIYMFHIQDKPLPYNHT